ncbi:cystin-1 [Camelus bactrianus]|uniref:Cystin-1 n=1 Tax=Camelus bactrianus TaxID=9837 RepID=A0AC58NIZ1_CAMBA
MGSGSSRSGRALRRLRSPDSRPAGPGGAAPEGGTGPPGSAAAAAAAREEDREAAAEAAEEAAGPGPAAPPDGGDETLRLLDQLLAESAAWGPGELTPRGPARPRPAAGAGSPVSPKQSTEDHPGNSSASSEAPDSCYTRPERQLAITYDQSEEELMASIEQEFCS